jgi:3-oxoadipate enol-lactonase
MNSVNASLELAYVDQGSGLPLVLIHGFPLNKSIWSSQIDILGQFCYVVAPDLRGSGESPTPPGEYSMFTLADDIRNLLDTLQIHKAVLCGLSMGGYVAFSFFRAWPTRVKALIFVNSRATADSLSRRAERLRLIRSIERDGLQPLVEQQLPSFLCPKTTADQNDLKTTLREIMLTTNLQGAIGTLKGMASRKSNLDLLPQINVPTLLIVGQDDIAIPPQESAQMHALIPNSQLLTIERTGHMVNMEQPDAFNSSVVQFLCQGVPN